MEHGAVSCPLGRKLLTLELSSILERCSLRKKSPKKANSHRLQMPVLYTEASVNWQKAYFTLNSLETHWRPALSLWIEKCVLHLKRY